MQDAAIIYHPITGAEALFIGAKAPITDAEAPCSNQQVLYLLASVSCAVFVQAGGAGALFDGAEALITEADHCHY